MLMQMCQGLNMKELYQVLIKANRLKLVDSSVRAPYEWIFQDTELAEIAYRDVSAAHHGNAPLCHGQITRFHKSFTCLLEFNRFRRR